MSAPYHIEKLADLALRLDRLGPETARMLVNGLERMTAVTEANVAKGDKWLTRTRHDHYRHACAHLDLCDACDETTPIYNGALDTGPAGDGLPHADHAMIRLAMMREREVSE